MKDVKEIREDLAKRQKRVQVCYVAYTLIYVAALALGVRELLVPAVVIGGANMVGYFLFLRGQVKGYSHAVARANILCGLCRPLTEAEYTDREGLDWAAFQDLALLPIRDHPSSLLVREGFAGKGFGLSLKGWEVSFHYPVYGKGRTDYRFLSGSILTAEGPARPDGDGDWLLIRKGMVDAAAQDVFVEKSGFRACKCPVEALSKSFDVYSRTGAPMPRGWADQFSRLFKQAGSLGAVRASPRAAAVYLGNRFYTGRTKVRELPGADKLERNPLPERDKVWEFFRFWSTAGKNRLTDS